MVIMKNPDIRPIGPSLYRLEEDVSYLVGCVPVFIRKGFVYDGASIPRPVWSLVGLYPGGVMEEPALLHDYLYIHGGVVSVSRDRISRAMVDKAFFDMMIASGVRKSQAYICYAAVRIFGGMFWNNKKMPRWGER